MKTLLKVALGLALSTLTLFLFARNLDFAKVRDGIAGASLPLLLLAIVIGYFGHLSLRAWRWATMLRPLRERVSFYNLFSTTAIGYAISWLAPGRIGEVVRPLLLSRREAIPAGASIATVGVERVLDAVTVLALAACAALVAPFWWGARGGAVLLSMPVVGETELVRVVAWLGVMGLGVCTAGVLAARVALREGSWFMRLLDRRASASVGLRRRLWGFTGSLASGALFLRDGRQFLRVAGQSVLVWGAIGLSTWIGLLAAGVRIPFMGTFLLLALAVMGIAVPTPGGAGTVHYAFQRGLIGLFGIDANLASAATVIYHPVLVYIPPVVIGLGFAWRDGLTPGRLRALAQANPDRDLRAEGTGELRAEGGLGSGPAAFKRRANGGVGR